MRPRHKFVHCSGIQHEDRAKVGLSLETRFRARENVVGADLNEGGRLSVELEERVYTFRTNLETPKLGLLLVGLGGNNGSTLVGGIVANRKKLKWRTKSKECQEANYLGSLTQSTTVRLGRDAAGNHVHVPFSSVLPMVHPDDLVVSGWDINGANLAEATRRAGVFEPDLRDQLHADLAEIYPMPGVFYPEFVAANQTGRANNVVPGNEKRRHVEEVRRNIRDFKARNGLDKVVVMWTANTEKMAATRFESMDEVLDAIDASHPDVSPSVVYAVAAITEGCAFVNGSPQNTLGPGVLEMARAAGVLVAGEDFKTGQTKVKSVLVDFLVSSGIKPEAIVSYNHLGNNDGKNLSEDAQFKSKQISKTGVIDDMVAMNGILFPQPNANDSAESQGEHKHHQEEHKLENKPDHEIVIKYVPFVKDSKRAMDEYTSSIFMGGTNTMVIHNTCEDSLLAVPVMLDLVVLIELFSRIQVDGNPLSGSISHLLGFLLKAPLVDPTKKAVVVNALTKQHRALTNTLLACAGLAVDTDMVLDCF